MMMMTTKTIVERTEKSERRHVSRQEEENQMLGNDKSGASECGNLEKGED